MNVIAPMESAPRIKQPERIGPYTVYDEIGCGGMASVHLGKLRSPSGFTRIVAIKRMHTDLARSPEFVAMFFEEARLIARIHHPNVVAAIDCVALDNTAMLVMDYVHGVSLDQLMRQLRGDLLPPAIASAILVGAALGLHAAHEAVDEDGKNLGIVHRDVSPHNILVGVDGLARVLDFGIAKAAERAHHTRTGEVKGKIGYMAPEQLFQNEVRREADVYSLGVIMWELMTGRRLFAKDSHGQMMMRIANSVIDPPSTINPQVKPDVEAVIMRALSRAPEARYRTALEFASAVEACIPPVYQRELGRWIVEMGGEELTHRTQIRSRIDVSAPGLAGDRAVDATVITSRLRLPAIGSGEDRASLVAPAPPASQWRSAFLVGAGILGGAVIASAVGLSTRAPAPADGGGHGGPQAALVQGVAPGSAAQRGLSGEAAVVASPAAAPAAIATAETTGALPTTAAAPAVPSGGATSVEGASAPANVAARGAGRLPVRGVVHAAAPATRGKGAPGAGPAGAGAPATPAGAGGQSPAEIDLGAIGGRE